MLEANTNHTQRITPSRDVTCRKEIGSRLLDVEGWGIWVSDGFYTHPLFFFFFFSARSNYWNLMLRKAIQYAKARKLQVIGVDVSDAQLEDARLLGADLTFNSVSQPDYITDLFRETGGAHAAVVLSASNAAYASAPDVLRSGSSLYVVFYTC